MQLVEFLIERALFVARQAATVLGRHIAGFLCDGVEAAVQFITSRRRVIALIHMIVDIARLIADSTLDLLAPLHGDGMGVRFHDDTRSRGRPWRLNHTA